MFFTGFADEAGRAIETQIRATRELGWTFLEARAIDGINITDIPDALFEETAEKLSSAGISVSCLGSAVANWQKDPLSEEDFQESLAELSRAIPRMRRLGTRMLRGMSFSASHPIPDSPEIEREVFRKVRALVRRCEEADVLYLHENCMNYGGLSYEHTLKLLDAVRSPNLALVFDTGNPVFTMDRRGKPPYRLQSSWEFYTHVKQFVRYVHIKDGRYKGPSDGLFPRVEYTWPGEGDGEVVRIVRDLIVNHYNGGLSIEPHMSAVRHEHNASSQAETDAFHTYVEYGKRLMKLAGEAI